MSSSSTTAQHQQHLSPEAVAVPGAEAPLSLPPHPTTAHVTTIVGTSTTTTFSSQVDINPTTNASSPPSPPFRVLYMTDEMVVVDKPHGVPMDGAHHPSTVEKWIQWQMKSDDGTEAARKNDGEAEVKEEEEEVAEDVASPPNDNNTNTTTTTTARTCGGGTEEEGCGGGIGAHRMPQGYFTTPLPQGNRHTSSGGNAGPSRKQLKFVHQLDAPTSGLLCLAFSRDVAARLGHCFQMRKSVKVYSAILFGWVGDDTRNNNIINSEDGGDVAGGSSSTTPTTTTTTPSSSSSICRGSGSTTHVFDGIPISLNDYLAAAPTTTTADGGSTMMLRPLSPYAALYDPAICNNTATTTGGGGGGGGGNVLAVVPEGSDGGAASNPGAAPTTRSSVVMPPPPPTLINIDAPIGNDPTDGSTLMTIGGTNPRDASSLLQVVKRGYVRLPSPSCVDDEVVVGDDGVVVKATHVLLRLYTGRRHQLRLHCRHIGHPIVGDASYVSEIPQNAKIENDDHFEILRKSPPSVLDRRMYLHAWRLAFFDSFEVGDHGKRERVEARKKRRRESLGINNNGGGNCCNDAEVTTGVSTGPDPFAHLVVDSTL